MSIKAVISEVLKKRHQNVPMLEQTERELLELSRQLDALRSMASDTADSANVPPDFRDATANIANQVGNLQQDITELLPKVTNLTERFRKETINIGVSGKTGQGKSTLLQSISSLSNREIPAASGLACTASKSMIYHIEGAPHARIDFYSEDEFLKEIIMPHFNALNLPKPYSLRDFESPLPEITADRIIDQANYERLVKIHTLFPTVKHLLSTSKQITLDEIRNYVIQEYPVSIVVKTAHIYTNFPNHDVTGLCLVDLPGLEAVLNHERKLVASLEREVDAVIFLKQPNAMRAEWSSEDYKVLDLINESIKEIKLTDWLFIVLNELEGGSNAAQIQLLKENPPVQYNSLNMLISQCKNPADVERNVFAPVLKHLEQNLEKIDRVLLESLARSVEQIVSKLNDMVTPIFPALTVQHTHLVTHHKFKELSRTFMERLRKQLRKLVEEVQKAEYLNDIQTSFLAKVKEVCDAADQSPPVPSIEDLRDACSDENGWPAVVQRTLNHLRSYLAKDLASGLNVYLKYTVDEVYRKVLIQILPSDLSNLFSSEAETDPRRRLEILYRLFDPAWQPKLSEAFRYMFDFDFSYQSHFHYRVRQEMKPLDPRAYDFVKEIIPENAQEEQAEDIKHGLETKYQEAVYRVRKRFSEEMRNDPSNAIFALVEEIRDQLGFAEGIENEWDNFLFVRKGQVWPDVFGQIDREIERQKHWQAFLNDILAAGKTLQQMLRK